MKQTILIALSVIAASVAQAESKVALYAGVGPDLTQFDVDINGAALTKRGTVTVPGNVQYVWQHPSKKYLYVAWSQGGPTGAFGRPSGGGNHGVHAFKIDAS